MIKVKEYKIVEEDRYYLLERCVNDWIKAGFQPVGSAKATIVEPFNIKYTQTLMKYVSEDEPEAHDLRLIRVRKVHGLEIKKGLYEDIMFFATKRIVSITPRVDHTLLEMQGYGYTFVAVGENGEPVSKLTDAVVDMNHILSITENQYEKV